jgi:hypothetical protein
LRLNQGSRTKIGQESKVATKTAVIAPKMHQKRILTQAGERWMGDEVG